MGRIKSKIFLSNVGLKPSPAARRKKRQNLNTFDILYCLLGSVSFSTVALYSRLGEDKFVLYFLFDACFMRRRLMRGKTAEVEKHES